MDVVWLVPDGSTEPARGMWDQQTVEEACGRAWPDVKHRPDLPDGDCLIVVPGRPWAGREAELVALADGRRIVVTSDEERRFDADLVSDGTIVQYVRGLGNGPTPWIRGQLDASGDVGRDVAVSFAGQDTHPQRHQAVQAVQDAGGVCLPSKGFTEGLPPAEYAALLAKSRFVACPAGPLLPDTFRLYEAIEAGAVPVLAHRRYGYWADTWGAGPDCPTLDDWDGLPVLLPSMEAQFDRLAACAQAWWSQTRRQFAFRLNPTDVGITAVIPTSPTPTDPDPSRTLATIDSILDRAAGCEIVLFADGVRPEQADRRHRYNLYLRALADACTRSRRSVTMVVGDRWLHQAAGLQAIFGQIRTDLMLYVEHDTPLAGDIDLDLLAQPIRSGELDVVRLHPDTEIFEGHRHLMVGDVTVMAGVPILRTVQWSQRPHLASTGFYRDSVLPYFAAQSRTMIEDVMHSVVASAGKSEGWGRFKVGIYHPEGSIQRSTHSDGRGDDPKFPMQYRPSRTGLPYAVTSP